MIIYSYMYRSRVKQKRLLRCKHASHKTIKCIQECVRLVLYTSVSEGQMYFVVYCSRLLEYGAFFRSHLDMLY